MLEPATGTCRIYVLAWFFRRLRFHAPPACPPSWNAKHSLAPPVCKSSLYARTLPFICTDPPLPATRYLYHLLHFAGRSVIAAYFRLLAQAGVNHRWSEGKARPGAGAAAADGAGGLPRIHVPRQRHPGYQGQQASVFFYVRRPRLVVDIATANEEALSAWLNFRAWTVWPRPL